MVYDPNLHHRRSIRLKGYDYGQRGAYFVTLCTHRRVCWFGEVEESGCDEVRVNLTPCGELMRDEWLQLPTRFAGLELDAFVFMPNHLHAILVLPGDSAVIGDVVGGYKSLTTIAYGRRVKQNGWLSYEQRFWHRNYWEHIVRDETDLNRIRAYIALNPARWPNDNLYQP